MANVTGIRIPAAVRHEVIAEIYRRLDDMRWEERTAGECSAAYVQFVQDPAIGGALAPFIPKDRIRVWIKDGPAKEYRRALEGVGSYAEFTTRQAPPPQKVVNAAIGADWSVVDGTVADKPMRCTARMGDESRRLIWGPAGSLKDLVWHAAVHLAERPHDGAVTVAITRRGNAPIDGPTWKRARSLANVIGFETVQLMLPVERKTTDD